MERRMGALRMPGTGDSAETQGTDPVYVVLYNMDKYVALTS